MITDFRELETLFRMVDLDYTIGLTYSNIYPYCIERITVDRFEGIKTRIRLFSFRSMEELSEKVHEMVNKRLIDD